MFDVIFQRRHNSMYNRLELSKSGPQTNPNAHLNTISPNQKGQVTAEAAAGLSGVKNPVRDVNDIRRDVADGAAVVGRGSDITAATSTMAAAVPGPHQPGAAATALVSTGFGLAANVVEQVARPDMGKGLNDTLSNILQERVDKRIPIAAPITNELFEVWKQSETNKDLQTWSNQIWMDFSKNIEGGK